MVKDFYREVARLPQITDHAIGTIMQELSIHNEFDTIAALKELYIYVTKYRDQVRMTKKLCGKFQFLMILYGFSFLWNFN